MHTINLAIQWAIRLASSLGRFDNRAPEVAGLFAGDWAVGFYGAPCGGVSHDEALIWIP